LALTEFALWAPNAKRVELRLERAGELRRHELTRDDDGGCFRADLPDVDDFTRYAYALDGGEPLADPRSPRQPLGVHGPSEVTDTAAFPWADQGWRGRPLAGGVVYEMHIGTFTTEGTFDAAIDRLDHLTALGVDFVEVLPVAAFNGAHGWGYDGVCLYAVHEPYGGPREFARFVDACHERGLGVVLDVVYNHLGPSGNHLAEFGPYFTAAHTTPWGPAMNLDQPGSDEVRDYIIDNALRWLRDFHVDGLRLDAVHALADDRATPLLAELSAAVDELSGTLGRTLFLIAETDRNDPATVTAREAGGLGLHAQWDDDVHHALHTLLTGEAQGYYADFAADPYAALARTFRRVFFHDGTYSSFRGRHHGRAVNTLELPASRFLAYLQTHDQVGNRAVGDRIGSQLSPGLRKVGAALVLTGPFTPMLFMGEEWGAGTPWQYFSDHGEPELAAAVRDGRRAEFAAFGWAADDVPDPQDPATFRNSKLDWSELSQPEHAELLDWYRELIALRRAEPELTDPWLANTSVSYDAAARWIVVRRGGLRVAVNLADHEQMVPLDQGPELAALPPVRAVLAASEAGVKLPAETAPNKRPNTEQDDESPAEPNDGPPAEQHAGPHNQPAPGHEEAATTTAGIRLPAQSCAVLR
jgi:maltooligosyltrehalose trehalohydrolase